MNARSKSFPWLALGALCSFMLLPLSSHRLAFTIALVGCAVFFSVAILVWLLDRFKRDKYDLNELREMVIGGTYDETDVPEADDDGDKYCMHCHTVYGAQFGVCPKCGR
jgi:hypothetical protein